MATKNNPGKWDCYAAADPDEPLFVLRANDERAPQQVLNWVHATVQQIVAGQRPNTPEQWDKVREAVQCVHDMAHWHHEKYCKPRMEAAAHAIADELREAGATVIMPGEEKPKLN